MSGCFLRSLQSVPQYASERCAHTESTGRSANTRFGEASQLLNFPYCSQSFLILRFFLSDCAGILFANHHLHAHGFLKFKLEALDDPGVELLFDLICNKLGVSLENEILVALSNEEDFGKPCIELRLAQPLQKTNPTRGIAQCAVGRFLNLFF